MMEAFVTWWCHFIGITDPIAVQTAVGATGAGSLIIAVWFILELVVGVCVAILTTR